jgi:hypothetical protein
MKTIPVKMDADIRTVSASILSPEAGVVETEISKGAGTI